MHRFNIFSIKSVWLNPSENCLLAHLTLQFNKTLIGSNQDRFVKLIIKSKIDSALLFSRDQSLFEETEMLTNLSSCETFSGNYNFVIQADFGHENIPITIDYYVIIEIGCYNCHGEELVTFDCFESSNY